MTSQSRVKHIPGFYYDPEKRRYFRVRPGHNMHNPLTWESIAKREEIRKRHEVHHRSQSSLYTNDRLEGIPTLLRNRETNISCCRAWQNKVTKKRLVSMRPRTVLRDSWSRAPNQVLLEASQTRLFVSLSIGSNFNFLMCFEVSPDSLDLKFTSPIVATGNLIYETVWHESMYVALRPHSCAPSSPVGIVVGEELPPILFDRDRKETRTAMRFSGDTKSHRFTRCCWQRNITRPTEVAMTQKAGKPVVLCNIETQNAMVLPAVIQRSEVLCIEFMARSPVLVAGCRNSSVYPLDLRIKHTTRAVRAFSMESSVGSLKVLKDENYVLAMGLNGQFSMYDLRLGQPVVQYQQHVGTHRQMLFCTNNEETLIFAPGQDHIVRIWDIHNSQPIQQFVPELAQDNHKPMGQDQIPCVAYGNNLGGTTPGLLTSTDNSVHCYTI